MLDMDDRSPFSPEAVRAFPGQKQSDQAIELNPMAALVARQFGSNSVASRTVRIVWRGVEALALLVLGLLIHAGLGSHVLIETRFTAFAIAGAGAAVVLIGLVHGYQISVLRGGLRQFPRVGLAWLGACLLIAFTALMLEGAASPFPLWLALWLVGGSAVLAAGRYALGIKLRQWARDGVMERRAVIVGGGQGAAALLNNLELQPDSDIRICGIFDDRGNRRSPPVVAGYPKLGTVRELVEFARIARIDMLIVTLPLTAEARVLSILKQLWVLPLDIRLSAHASQIKLRPRAYSFIGELPFLDVFDRPLTTWDTLAKRTMDLVVGTLAIVLLSPVMLVTALAIKLDSPGPVFFRQKRHGFNNQVIEILKFRSLYHDMADVAARKVVTKNDPRVTRVGRFIRRSSIDELPQLFNVLSGSLSLVGPRPHAVHALSSQNEAFVEIVDGYFGRHKVKPGITGWAQINGWRGEIDEPAKLKKRFEHDLHYIENWSIFLDLLILLKTPYALLFSKNAY
ncbi:undecaprenyl-phosphate glucose phosphotransferase [Consotaella aegiceratis]|uniref:undecaprenyl-phosphate glucose phosphotransferase n=1 Tax=Consotaella aegiceratis TaxID=3097961 RepID=UPI002F403552